MKAGEIDSWEWIPGLLKSLKIRAPAESIPGILKRLQIRAQKKNQEM
jgi:hypothetical protein